MEIKIFESKSWGDYELLDTGEGEKLERVGGYVFSRPYEGAFWKKSITWKADGKFEKGKWHIPKQIKKWQLEYKGIKFWAGPTPFRHFGFFPEQEAHWEFIEKKISAKGGSASGGKVKFLNLFGYTGVASLVALQAGAEVTHVDASSQSIDNAKENQKLSRLEDKPMRVIVDDALKFLLREEKRGNKYDAVIMDPPKFGRGPKGEIWKIEESLPKLLEQVEKILSDKPLFVILTSYAADLSALTLKYALEDTMKNREGNVEAGEMCLKEKSNGRLIPLANTAVWSN